MKNLNRYSLVLITVFAVIGSAAYGQQPPNPNPSSDAYGNSAYGYGALLNLTGGTIGNTAVGQGTLNVNTTGQYNTAIGWNVLLGNTTGGANAGIGSGALAHNTTGGFNTAAGYNTLYSNTTGNYNIAVGSFALQNNTTGDSNTAIGLQTLASNTSGQSNTASGFSALFSNTTGSNNAAYGNGALSSNTTGSLNTASGGGALGSNSTGNSNTASGYQALFSNTLGAQNVASGVSALRSNTSGNSNVALGGSALFQNATGFRNVALGYEAGYALTGSDNIFIGAKNPGSAAANGVIRIGTKAFQKKAFIAGIQGVKTGSTTASAVFVDVNGQLGTIKSSGRYKEDIQPMGSVSERLFALRPVTFRYKEPDEDGSKPVQFGLVAEEVAEAFPELVVYDEEGKPETVSYHLLATLLLNEFQKEHRATEVLRRDNAAMAARMAGLEQQSAELAQLKKQVAMMAEVIERLDHERMVATTR